MNDTAPPRETVLAVLVAATVLATLVGPAVASTAQEAGQVRIAESSFDESGVFATRGDTQYLWADERTSLTVALETSGSDGEGHYEVCVRTDPADGRAGSELECRAVVLAGNSTEELTFAFDGWPGERLGEQSVSVVVTADTLSREEAARVSHAVSVVEKAADDDGDGATNRREVAGGTDFTDSDTDDDGLPDGLELDTYETDPTGADTDGDGLDDGTEVDTHRTDPDRADTDGDGLDDAAEVDTHGTDPNRADTDGDGLDDAQEVNTHETDPADGDTDDDGLSDAAEVREHETNPTEADTDGDGLNDALEVYTYETNPAKADTDDDGLGDGVEVHEVATDPTSADTDGDGLPDGTEVNSHGTNPNRADTDGDGLPDGAEVNTHETDPTLADTDGDGVGDPAEVDTTGGGPPLQLLLGVPVLGGALGGALWATRGRWLPHVPAPIRVQVVAAGAAVRRWARRWIERGRGLFADRGGPGGTSGGDGSSSDGHDHPEPGPDDGPAEVPLEMLSNEDAVLAVLRRNGGRVRQSALVEETGWSKSKVSRVLSRMDDAGQVTKINVGRGNVITLPGEEPEGANSPFSE